MLGGDKSLPLEQYALRLRVAYLPTASTTAHEKPWGVTRDEDAHTNFFIFLIILVILIWIKMETRTPAAEQSWKDFFFLLLKTLQKSREWKYEISYCILSRNYYLFFSLLLLNLREAARKEWSDGLSDVMGPQIRQVGREMPMKSF